MPNLPTDNNLLSSYLKDFQSGSRPRGGVGGISNGVPSIGGEHLNSDGGFNFEKMKFIPKDFANSMTKGIIEKNDVLVVKDGATTGKVTFVDENFPYEFATINEHVFLLRANEKILPRFLFWYLWSQQGQSEILKNFQGSAQGGINRSFVEGVEVPSIPIDEQEKIVRKIDKLSPIAKVSRDKILKAKQLIQKFRQAVLAAAVTGKLTEEWRVEHPEADGKKEISTILNLEFEQKLDNLPNAWGEIPSVKVFSFVTSGSRGWAKYYAKEGSLFVRVGNLEHNSISLKLEDNQYVNLPDKTEGKRTKLQPNDILISITADIGRIALVPESIGEAYLNQHVALARPVDFIYPPFLAWYLATYQGGWSQFVEKQRGATKVGLGLDDISSISIPFPSMAEQEEIVFQINKYLDIARSVEHQIEKANSNTEKLTQAILAKAFRGELIN